METERVVRLETEMESIKTDVSDIKHSVHEMNQCNIDISKSLVKLTVIADENRRIEMMLEPRVAKLERIVWRAIGVFSGIMMLFSVLSRLKVL